MRISCVVVDDDQLILDYVTSVLSETYELDLHSFRTPADAVAHLKHHRTHILITDIVMPEMDGIDLLDQAREIDSLTQVIMMSAYSTIGRVIVSLQHGAADFVMKPFQSPDNLLVAVTQTIARWNRWTSVLRDTAMIEGTEDAPKSGSKRPGRSVP